MKKHSIKHWKAARFFPETYPGECPDTSFLYYGNEVQCVAYSTSQGFLTSRFGEKPVSVNEVLSKNQLPPLEDRFPVIAYGANRNPATISIKLKNYNYQNSGKKEVMPMLKGTLHDADVVASGIHGQGYFYGDLLLHSRFTRGCAIEVWISLLDKDQLRVMNESEGIVKGLYSLAWIDNIYLADTGQKIRSLLYVSNSPMLILNKMPIAFSQVKAIDRTIPALTTLEMLNTFIDTFNLQKELSTITGIPTGSNLASELVKYLNGQWWYQFNTRMPPLEGFKKVLDLFNNMIIANSIECGSANYLRELDQCINAEQAKQLKNDLTFQ